MWAGRAEAGPRAGLGRGRWSLQVPSKCFEWTERRPFELIGTSFEAQKEAAVVSAPEPHLFSVPSAWTGL